MAIALNSAVSRAAAHPCVSGPRRPVRSVVVASSNKDNPYHDRETTKSRRSNPGGTKDANVVHSDKDAQFEYQQERLEWRRKNQTKDATIEGEDRVEPPTTNLAQGDSHSAERRGPEVEGSSGHGDTLKELVDNLTGKKKKHDKEDK